MWSSVEVSRPACRRGCLREVWARYQSVNLLHSRSHSQPSPPHFRSPHLLLFSSCKTMKTGGQFALLDFPVEIICHIFSFLSCRDLVHSTLVSDSEPPPMETLTNAILHPRNTDVQTYKEYSAKVGLSVIYHRPCLPPAPGYRGVYRPICRP